MPVSSKLHIETALRNDKTILKNSFAQHPFKLADVTEQRSEKFLQMMIRSSSPGVLDGDDYYWKIDVAENSSLQLETQSYQRLFTMKNGAKQLAEIYLQPGASLIYTPHPLVPHKNSSFVSRSNIHLKNNCELIWGEVMSCGRKENGEVFCFSSYHSITQIFLNERLVVKENILMKPGEIDFAFIGQLEGFTHQASLIFLNEQAQIEELISILVEELNVQKNIAFGVSSLSVNGLVVRLMGYKAEQLFDLLKNICARLKTANQKIFNKEVNVA